MRQHPHRHAQAEDRLPAAFGGAVLMAFSVGLDGVGTLASVAAADQGIGDAVTTVGFLADFSWVPWVASAAVMYLAAGVGGLRTAALPRWLAIVSVVLGVLCLTGPTGIAVFLVTPVWLAVVGVVLGRRRTAATLPTPRTAAPVTADRARAGQTL